MKLLVSTVSKLLVWMPDGIETIHEGQGSYSGATWSEDRIFVVTQNRQSRSEYADNQLLIFDGAFRLLDVYDFPNEGPTAVSSVHDVFYWQGKVYVVSTANSRAVAWEPSGKLETVYTAPPRVPDKWSVNTNAHLNSVWNDGQNFYVVEHRHGPSQIKQFDPDWQWKKTWFMGHESHNVYREGPVLYCCASWHHAVAMRDLQGGGERWVKVMDGLNWIPGHDDKKLTYTAYPRGLARTKDKWFVGLSATARRGDRDKGDSCILVFDNDWHKLDEIVLPDTGGIGTGGVRVMDETDYAHNRIPCP